MDEKKYNILKMFNMEQGLKQGCLIFPWLFNIFMVKHIGEVWNGFRDLLVGNYCMHIVYCIGG